MMPAMDPHSRKVLSLLLAVVVALLPLQSLASDVAACHTQSRHAGEPGLVHLDLSQDDCASCYTGEHCGQADCHVPSHCTSLLAMTVSRALLLSDYLLLKRLVAVDVTSASLLISTIYRPPWA